MANWAGKTLGNVHIEGLVARGGMAEVYTGMHESLGQVAIKVMRGILDKDSEQLARFQREAEVIEELRHPNIVQMFAYDIADESPYLVMEYIPGPSLAAYLKALHEQKQRMPIGMVAQVLKSIAGALDYAHAKGIVHRDIKPANVLLRSHAGTVELNKPLPQDVEPVLTDFGLVRLLDSTMHTTAGSVSGTPTYMSPEQARGEKVDKRTDIYSLGIMLYEMLAGTVPFQADTTFGMLMKHINEPPPPIEGLSEGLQAILDRTLSKDPSFRYENAGDLANEFIALFNGETVSPGTLHIAQLARQASEASKQNLPPPAEEKRSTRWIRIGGEIVIALALALLIFRFSGLAGQTGVPTSIALDPNAAVGRMRFSFSSSDNDKVTITLTGISLPEQNKHLEAWLVSDNETYRDIGQIAFDPGGIGLEYTDPAGENLLDGLKEVQITQEENEVPISKPKGEVVYSSVFPTQALEYVRNLQVSYSDTPDNEALMIGLYYYSGSYLNDAINGSENDPSYIPITKAYEDKDEPTLRKRTEELINMIVGSQSDQYLDYDKDGTVDDPADGYGSLPNGTNSGYLQETALYAKSASDAPDSTPNIREQGKNIQVCIQNMDGWTNELLPLALKLNDTSVGAYMQDTIDQISQLGVALVNGVDKNNNGHIEPVAGECVAS
ncbi:MAG TPA: serine/threonine-protein kinase, partial [Anaerolineales bacterium]|nr:serine/threonine-protein kinase [Anaerolineales bacterium]